MEAGRPIVLYLSPEFPKVRHGFEATELVHLSGTLTVRLVSLRAPQEAALRWWNESFQPHGPVTLDSINPISILSSFVRWALRRPRRLSEYLAWAVGLVRYDALGAAKVAASVILGCAVADRVRRSRADWIHADFASAPATVAMVAAGLSGVPFSFCGHAFDVFSTIPAGEATPVALARKLREARVVFGANSQCVQRLVAIAHEGGAHPRVVLKRNGVQSLPQPLALPPSDPPILLGLGALVGKKGFDILIEAAALLKAAYPSVRVRIAGEGPERERLASLAARLNVPLELPGAYAYSALGALMRDASAVVLPSRLLSTGDSDGVPTVLIEALAFGRPVVGTDVGSLTDLILAGKTGWVVAAEDPAALAAGIAEVLGDPEHARELALNGRELVAMQFMVADASALLTEYIRSDSLVGGP